MTSILSLSKTNKMAASTTARIWKEMKKELENVIKVPVDNEKDRLTLFNIWKEQHDMKRIKDLKHHVLQKLDIEITETIAESSLQPDAKTCPLCVYHLYRKRNIQHRRSGYKWPRPGATCGGCPLVINGEPCDSFGMVYSIIEHIFVDTWDSEYLSTLILNIDIIIEKCTAVNTVY